MVSTALLVLALAAGGGAPYLGGFPGLVGFWAGHGDVGNILDPDGGVATGDVGGILDPDGATAPGDVGGILDPNG